MRYNSNTDMVDDTTLAPTAEDMLATLMDAVAEVRRLGQRLADLQMETDRTNQRMKAARAWVDSVRAQLDDAVLGER